MDAIESKLKEASKHQKEQRRTRKRSHSSLNALSDSTQSAAMPDATPSAPVPDTNQSAAMPDATPSQQVAKIGNNNGSGGGEYENSTMTRCQNGE